MFFVENNCITVTKGDSGFFLIKLKNADGTEFVPGDKDKIAFSVKRRKDAHCPIIIHKTGEKIVFEKEETEKIPSGEYVYDITVLKSTGERYTAVEGEFIVRKVVHNFE